MTSVKLNVCCNNIQGLYEFFIFHGSELPKQHVDFASELEER